MTDEDFTLLQAVARVVGLRIAWDERRYGHRDEPMTRVGWRVINDDGLLGDWWNPLRYDADAFAIALNQPMQINNYPDCVEARVWNEQTGREECIVEASGETLDKRRAAMRRAIVRAVVGANKGAGE